MKKLISFAFAFVLVIGCSKKTVPTKTTVQSPSTNNKIDNSSTTTPPTEIPPTATTRVANVNAMIVIDGNGRILTPLEKLPPEENLKPDYSKIARAFTPAQKANLTLRYKMVPPKVIYVPDIFAQKSLKGTYSIYKKKFWYWKKEDGLFYLDETYYK
ncbi:MAG: hypothetical protein H7068_09650 [Pedobacter sp.]|nr:hypothetical protein [Chitinophagaceae bacterium]